MEADALLNDLQSSLHSQEEKLTAFAKQQREVCKFILDFSSTFIRRYLQIFCQI